MREAQGVKHLEYHFTVDPEVLLAYLIQRGALKS